MDISLKNKTILIGEDNTMNSLLLRKILEKTGAKIIIADDGNKVVETVRNSKIDLVLMDIQMPEKDGIEAAKEIRTEFPNIPIIFQTAFRIDQNIFPADIFDDIILKPINKNILLEKIIKLIL